jgi:hypothetical protein
MEVSGKMKLKSLLAVIAIMIILAVVGIIELWPSEASVVVFQHKEHMIVHPNYRRVLGDNEDLKALRLPRAYLLPREALRLKIVNTGEKLASNLRLFFASIGHLEIFYEAKAFVIETDGEWVLESLHPGAHITLLFWPDPTRVTSRAELKQASLDNGQAKIVDRYVARTEQNYVIEFGWLQILYAVALECSLIMLTFIVTEKYLTSQARQTQSNNGPEGEVQE